MLDDSNPPFYRWFAGGELNTCYNAVDRQIELGRGEQRALIYDSPLTGVLRTITYRALRNEVALFARPTSEDSVREDPARHRAGDCGQPPMEDAGDDRRSRDSRRNHLGTEDRRLCG